MSKTIKVRQEVAIELSPEEYLDNFINYYAFKIPRYKINDTICFNGWGTAIEEQDLASLAITYGIIRGIFFVDNEWHYEVHTSDVLPVANETIRRNNIREKAILIGLA